MCRIAKKLVDKEKNVWPLLSDPYEVPKDLRPIPESQRMDDCQELQNAFGVIEKSQNPLFILVDHDSTSRFGAMATNVEKQIKKAHVVIDHHASTDQDLVQSSLLNLIDPEAPSTTTIIAETILKEAPHLMDPTLATMLFAGLVTDTGGFTNDNTDARSFTCAANLATADAKIFSMTSSLISKKSLRVRKAEAYIYENAEISANGQLAVCAVPEGVFEDLGLSAGEGAGLGGILKGLKGPKVTVYIRALPKGWIRGSIRAEAPIDAAEIAQAFGGGGHARAAGFKTKGQLDTIKERATKEAIHALRKASERKDTQHNA